MAADLYTAVLEELRPGETLLWHGYCLSRLGKQGKSTGPQTGLYGGATAGFFTSLVLAVISDGYAAPLFLITVPAGAWLGYRFYPVTSAYRKSKTVYVLTDRRVFVLRDVERHRQVKSLPLSDLGDIKVLGQEERGTIFLSLHRAHRSGTSVPYLRLFMIRDAKHVAELIEQARLKQPAEESARGHVT